MASNLTFPLKSYLIAFFLFALSPSVFAQSNYKTRKTASDKAVKYYKEGFLAARSGHEHKAVKAYQKSLKKEPTFIDAKIELAGAKYRLGKEAESIKLLNEVLIIDRNYQPNILYTLAQIAFRHDKYEEAIPYLEEFIANPKSKERTIKKAKQLLANCQFAANAIKNPVPFEPKSLSRFINTPFSEYLPTITADGQTLIYTMRTRDEDFMVSKLVDGEWQAGVNLGRPINTVENEGAQSLAADGKTLYFTGCDRKYEGYGSCDIYVTKIVDGKWTKPRNLGKNINTAAWESLPSISADGQYLYFSAARKGNIGGKDLWVSRKDKNGKWQMAKNLGDVINTPQDEQSPFIHPDGKTLYFMSKGHLGMGEHDLFMAKKQKDGTWSKPKNLGYPINTKHSEGSLFISLDGKTAYFASDRRDLLVKESKDIQEASDKGFTRKNTDLYSFELYEEVRPEPVTYVKARVIDAVTKRPLKSSIEFVNLGENEVHAKASTDENGLFLVCLPLGNNFALNVSKEKYLFHSENFELTEAKSLGEPFLLDIELQAIPDVVVAQKDKDETPTKTPTKTIVSTKTKPIILKNIFFETAKADLRSESTVELNRLKQMLLDYPSMRIQINGHTDNVGKDGNNLSLSQRRAKAVVSFLVQNGIDRSRLNAKGFGENQPIDSNETVEGRQNNRRTEFLILN